MYPTDPKCSGGPGMQVSMNSVENILTRLDYLNSELTFDLRDCFRRNAFFVCSNTKSFDLLLTDLKFYKFSFVL